MADADLAFALELAELADSLSLPRFRAADLEVETKPDLTPVTDADRAVERALRERIAAERPGETVLGEEEGDDGGAVRWIVDPIDGTRNFSRGLPVWATLIALERDGRSCAASSPRRRSATAGGRRAARERGATASASRVSGVTSLTTRRLRAVDAARPRAPRAARVARTRPRRFLAAHARRRRGARRRGRRASSRSGTTPPSRSSSRRRAAARAHRTAAARGRTSSSSRRTALVHDAVLELLRGR